MKVSDIRSLGDEELKQRLEDLKREQFNLRFQAANMSLQNASQVRKVRRDIARMKTIFAEKKRADKTAASV